MYNGLIFLRKYWQMSSHLLCVQFWNYAVLCHTKILIQTVLCSQRISSMKWSVMVVMAVDYPILCGPCTNIYILVFSGNENNVITCHLLIRLGIYVVSQALWQTYWYEQLVSANCALWKKWYRKFGVRDTKSTLVCKNKHKE